MKRRQSPLGVRAALIDHFGGLVRLRAGWRESSWRRHEDMLAALEAGGPVELPGWLVGRFVPGMAQVPLVRLEADGTVTVMRLSPVRGGAPAPVRGGAT